MNKDIEFQNRYNEFINLGNNEKYFISQGDGSESQEFFNALSYAENYNYCVALYFHDFTSFKNSFEILKEVISSDEYFKAPKINSHFEMILFSSDTKLFTYSKENGSICRLMCRSSNKSNVQTALLHGITLNVFFKTMPEVDNFKLSLDKIFNIGCKSYLQKMNYSNSPEIINNREMLGIIRENYII